MLPQSASADTYGCPFKNSYPVQDPTTDQDESQLNEQLADCAAMTHTVGRAWAKIAGLTYTSGTQVIPVIDHDAVWGSASAVAPTCAQTAAGTYVLTWATTQTDELGSVHTINIRKPHAEACATTGRAIVWSWTANTVTVHATDVGGSANALNGCPVFVEWG